MKKIITATATLALMCGAAVAQTNQGAGSSNSGPANMQSGNMGGSSGTGTAGSSMNNNMGTTGSNMGTTSPAGSSETLTSKTTKKDGAPLNDNRGSQARK